MATGKRYYWIKLKDSFMSSDEIDYLMSQPDGANYVVLYQMLCLKTINTNGCLVSKIGEMLIPYDAEFPYLYIHAFFQSLSFDSTEALRYSVEKSGA